MAKILIEETKENIAEVKVIYHMDEYATEDAISVGDIPVADASLGAAMPYYNKETKEVFYEYTPYPKTDKERIDELIAENSELNKRLTHLQGEQLAIMELLSELI